MTRLLTIFFLLLHLACAGQILNGSFENWTFNPDVGINESKWKLNDWRHESPLGDSLLSLLGTYRDTTAQSGNFALGLSRWYNYTFDVVAFRNACPTKPTRLTGYFKYDEGLLSLNLTDTAQVSVFLTRYNTATHTTDTIGIGQTDLAGVDTFSFFQCLIAYAQPGVFPDSVTIMLEPTKFRYGFGGCVLNSWCSFLTVDELSLDFGTPAPEPPGAKPFSIFPNPATDKVEIAGPITGERVRVFNALGVLVLDSQAASDRFFMDVSGFNSGVYFVSIAGKAKTLVIK
ncbi:MAG: T9SS type A sorting domain-containing protein [Saprospiraceae bacterium]